MKRSWTAGILAMILTSMLVLGACSSKESSESSSPSASASESATNPSAPSSAAASSDSDPFGGWVEGLPKIEAPAGFDWKQFAGTTLNVITENTPPSSGLAANIETFEKATGIKVNIEQVNLDVVIEKAGLDFNARNDNYHIIYADPYQILAKQAKHFLDLNTLNNDPSLPHIPGGLEDFIQSQLTADGYMGNKDKLYALPYDNPTMVLAYRKDVFEKYKDQFMKEKGYDWTPGPDMTWDQYYEVAAWINQKVKEGVITEVKYGTGHQAKQHDSLMNDFSNVLASFGGQYFQAQNIGDIGTENPGKSLLNSPEAIAAAEFYNKLLKEAAPGSTSWDWSGLAEAFAAGEIAMAPEWHEFSGTFENPESSKVVGKVGWTILPKGPKGRANMYGGTGVGINKYVPEKDQKAAWLFLIWATSPQTQYKILDVGFTPTRYSVYEMPLLKKAMSDPTSEEAKKLPLASSLTAAQEAWKEGNVYMRPKIPMWPQIDTIVYTELSKMLAGRQSPADTMKEIAKQSDKLTRN
ncbi:ABC transporter substrate-binding protein [Cohnella caldifontis]|uniref:ABC transporter substrate-binding protein n=1 Tax=Cohnella caldifontis TaxID=3027471 RepID=UPI0023EBDA61|nr:sugar ABC transporter substrate-binding protein [Cohnella sp. YIM B05605]